MPAHRWPLKIFVQGLLGSFDCLRHRGHTAVGCCSLCIALSRQGPPCYCVTHVGPVMYCAAMGISVRRFARGSSAAGGHTRMAHEEEQFSDLGKVSNVVPS